jgi:hypothetical protein
MQHTKESWLEWSRLISSMIFSILSAVQSLKISKILKYYNQVFLINFCTMSGFIITIKSLVVVDDICYSVGRSFFLQVLFTPSF